MLVIHVRRGQSIHIGDDITVTFRSVSYDNDSNFDIVTLEFEAPREIEILGDWRRKSRRVPAITEIKGLKG